MRTRITRLGFNVALIALFAGAVSAGGLGPIKTENFDGVRSPVLPPGWVASQGVNVTGAPFWVTSVVTPQTAPNAAFSTAPANILDNRLDTPVLPISGVAVLVKFWHSYNLESGLDGAVLEISSPNINGGAFTDVTAPAAGGQFSGGGYNAAISSSFQSPIAGRMAWTGNSGGYILTHLVFPGLNPPQGGILRFRLASDNAGASAGWRIDTLSVNATEGSSPTPTPPASPTPTPTPIPTPCGIPNMIADSTFEAGVPWPGWTVQTSTNFGTPLCDVSTCGTGGSAPPYAGDNWAWFGGASAAETATLGQTVSILAGGQATLSFAMRIGTVSFPSTDVLNVRVDGTIVQSYAEPASAETLHSLRTINLGAFADGGSHNILFEYIGPTTGTCSYAVDNVTLTNGAACLTPTPSPTMTPTATPSATPTATVPPTATPTASDCPGVCGSPTPSPTMTPTVTPTATSTPPPTPTPSPTATPSPAPAQALNISTRLRVETGDRVIIGGFIITGNVPKKVAIRGVGPSLANSGLSDVLADPTLQLFDSDGSLMQNDDWQDDSAQAAQLTALGLALQNTKESGIVVSLSPGRYTAVMAGKNQTSGIGLVEIYDADRAAASQLANISTRGFVRTGDNVMIGGFILGHGSGSANVIVRALGPSLSHFMLPEFVTDPTLELRDSNGALLVANDDWQDDPISAAQLVAYGLQPSDPVESGIFASLAPGAFTAIVAGKNGDVGTALVEVYKVPNQTFVTTTADSGPGSLREALARARDGETVQFSAALNGQAINLTSGELLIDKSITIKGPGPSQLTVRRSSAGGTPVFRIFHVTPGHNVTIQGLTISNGLAQGGVPDPWGGGIADWWGGGIYNDGSTLIVADCVVSGNSADGAVGSGGGICNNADNSGHADLTINNSTVSGNFAYNSGGGVYSEGSGPLHHATIVLNGTTIRDNSSSSGGGLYNTGISFGDASLVLNDSTISGNSASLGGGIYNLGRRNSTNTSVIVRNSTISGNLADYGGAIFNSGGGGSATVEVAHSTISDNLASQQGGGLFNTGGATEPRSGAGLYPDGSGGSVAMFRNTILKTGASGENIYNNLGQVSSAGYNLSSDNGGGFLTGPGDQINTNPMLGPLADNFGPTFTHKLLTGSPAINAGDPNFAPPPFNDQRGPGAPRVIGGRTDIGSFELQP